MFYYACAALFTVFMYFYIQIQHTPFMPKGQYSAVLKYGRMTVTAGKFVSFSGHVPHMTGKAPPPFMRAPWSLLPNGGGYSGMF